MTPPEKREEQGDTWRGMGHSRVKRGSSVEVEEEEAERSDVASSSSNPPMRILANGEVVVVGVPAEEEKEEEEEIEEEELEEKEIIEENGGEELPDELKPWVKIHAVVQSVPDNNESEISLSYVPPEDVALLVVHVRRWEPSDSEEPNPRPKLNGEEGEELGSLVSSGDRYQACYAWKKPEAGTLTWGVDPTTSSQIMAAISVKEQTGSKPLKVDKVASRDASDSITLEKPSLDLTFPGLFINCYTVFQPANTFSAEHVGTRVVKKLNNVSGAKGERAFEVCIGLIGSSTTGVGYTPGAGAESDRCIAVGICEEE